METLQHHIRATQHLGWALQDRKRFAANFLDFLEYGIQVNAWCKPWGQST